MAKGTRRPPRRSDANAASQTAARKRRRAATPISPPEPPPAAQIQANPARGPACFLSFDDGTLDHLEIVLPLLERFKCRSLFFVPTSKLNRSGYLRTQDLQVFSRAGHAIGSHSHEHRRLDRLPEEDVRVQMELSQQILGGALGERPLFFAPPGGFTSPTVSRVASECGLRAIRTMRWGFNHRFDLRSLECIPLHQRTTEAEFRRILRGRGRRFTYAGKQLVKKLIPSRLYESLRRGVLEVTKGFL